MESLLCQRLLCLKNVALAVSVSDLKLVFHWSVQQERSKSAAMRVVDFFFFRGKACLSEWNAFRKKKKLVLFLKYCLCPTFFIVLPCLLVTVVRKRKKKKNPHIPLSSVLPPKSCKKLQICVTSVTRGVYTTVLKEARNGPDAE